MNTVKYKQLRETHRHWIKMSAFYIFGDILLSGLLSLNFFTASEVRRGMGILWFAQPNLFCYGQSPFIIFCHDLFEFGRGLIINNIPHGLNFSL